MHYRSLDTSRLKERSTQACTWTLFTEPWNHHGAPYLWEPTFVGCTNQFVWHWRVTLKTHFSLPNWKLCMTAANTNPTKDKPTSKQESQSWHPKLKLRHSQSYRIKQPAARILPSLQTPKPAIALRPLDSDTDSSFQPGFISSHHQETPNV